MNRILSGVLSMSLLVLAFPVSAHVAHTANSSFGFLTYGQNSYYDDVETVGAGWVRPHVGTLIWGEMQSSAQADVDFTESDKMVKQIQANGLHTLGTLWPYASWDQEHRSDYLNCVVNDEFANQLGQYRCNPTDWEAYASWVNQVVERYDGDGVDDMAGLTIPITHWGVNNEPDLQPVEADGLRFFIGGAKKYRKLLIQTSRTIHQADPSAQVLIAGASGGGQAEIDYYTRVLATDSAKESVDIGNVHCISSGFYKSFNVRPYADMLNELDLDIPIWVTEAETYVSADGSKNATQLKRSTSKALALGAKKIFYTFMSFTNSNKSFFPEPEIIPNPDLNPDTPIKTFHQIIDSLQ